MQIILQLIDVVKVEMYEKIAKAKTYIESNKATRLKLERWKVNNVGVRPKLKLINKDEKITSTWFSGAGTTQGEFDKDSEHMCNINLPKIIGIDLKQLNIWCWSIYNDDEYGTKDDGKKVIDLSKREYNWNTGLLSHRNWMEKKGHSSV